VSKLAPRMLPPLPTPRCIGVIGGSAEPTAGGPGPLSLSVDVSAPTPSTVAAGDEDRGTEATSPASLATATALVPLVAHRLLEHISARMRNSFWNEVAYHLLPPLGMIGASLWLWRGAPPLPGAAAKRRPCGRAIAIAAGLLLGTLAAAANLLSILAGNPGPGAVSSIAQASAAALVIHVALLAPVGEELAFRGLIYRHLRRGMLPLPATLISATIFSVMHVKLQQSVFAFLLGGVAAFAYEQTRSVVTPMLIHGLFNAVPVGVAAVRSRPDDVGPVWLVLFAVAMIFTLAARKASEAAPEN
jgi:membrane protease YdiL (CAAX protease family)